MKIELVQATNWLSHTDSQLAPDGAGFLTIRGDHGVGKTALVEAISYAMFGRGRFDTADEPVRLGATDMSVRVEWTAPDRQRYRVIRRRTTKAGGKGSLNFALQRPDGGWTSLDGEAGIKSTEAAIRDVVGVDGATFEAIAFLMQGRITALVEATAAGRRDVLVAGLLLDVWPRATARARKEAGEREARLAASRAQLERANEALEVLPELEAELGEARVELVAAEALVTTASTARDRLQAAIAALELKLAESKAAEAELGRLEADRGEIADAWHRARDRGDAARAQVTRLEEILRVANVDEAAAAAELLPGATANVDALVAGEAEDRRLTREVADIDRAIRDLEIPHQHARAAWATKHAAAVARHDELRALARAGASVCVSCGQVIDDKTARDQLAAATAAVKALGEPPQEPLAIAQARAARFRLETRQRELGWDPRAMVAAREDLERLVRLAAKADELVRVQDQLVRETATATEADAEKATLSEKGRAVSAEIATLQVRIAAAARFREERRAAGEALGRATAELELAQGSVRQGERAIAGTEARVEQLRALEADGERIRSELAGGVTEVAQLRRLAKAFGEIPLRIIDASLPDLELEAQALLDVLDPGAAVAISAQRATVDGKRIVSAIDITYTDAAGARDVRMTSGGERVAVSVALSLGLRRVLARQHGARLETAAIDEPDGLDAGQRRALAAAIRGLVHSGELARALLITHHEDLAEAGDAVYAVSKNGHGSVVELVT